MVRKMKLFKEILEKKLVKQDYFGICTLRWHLLDHMVGDIQKFAKLSVFGSSPYQRFNVKIK